MDLNFEDFKSALKVEAKIDKIEQFMNSEDIYISQSKNMRGFLNKKDNLAWYLGFIAGEVCKKGDWAFDANYQVVQAQSIPEQDVSGIGDRSNILCGTLTLDNRGFKNYKGWRFEALYALTDNLSIDAILEFLKHDRKEIKNRKYSKFEIQAIYAF